MINKNYIWPFNYFTAFTKVIPCKLIPLFFFFTAIIRLGGLQTNLYSQVTQEWVRRYNGLGNTNEAGYHIALDSLGNIYIAGTISSPTENTNVLVIKYNTSGIQQWIATYNGTGNGIDQPTGIGIDFTGNIYVVGYSEGSGFGSDDFILIKYNSNGIQQWVQRYNGPTNGSDQTGDIAIDKSSSIYITGGSPAIGGGVDATTIKYNSNGDSIWLRRFHEGSSFTAAGSKLALDTIGNIYVLAISSKNVPPLADYLTIKYNSSGVQQWAVKYSTNAYDYPSAIAVDKSGNAYVTGSSFDDLHNGEDYTTVKYNINGVQQWVSRYNGMQNNTADYPHAIVVDKYQNVYVTGESFSENPGSTRDYATLKYNTNGVQQWAARYNGPGNGTDYANALAIDDSDNIYITGYSTGSLGYNFGTVKYNTNGIQQWVMSYPGGGRDIIVDKYRNVYVVGGNSEAGTGVDVITIKYAQLVGVQQISSSITAKFKLFQNYPNPFNPVTNITYQVLNKSIVKLIVYNIEGKIILELVNDEQEAGIYNVTLPANNFASGIYLYSLYGDENFIDTKKMIILK